MEHRPVSYYVLSMFAGFGDTAGREPTSPTLPGKCQTQDLRGQDFEGDA